MYIVKLFFLPKFFFTTTMERKMLLCLCVANCVLFQDAMPEESLVNLQKITIEALNLIGYFEQPTDSDGWHQAFICLAKELKHQINVCNEDVKVCTKSAEECNKNVELYKNKSIISENESLSYKSVLKVHLILLEDMEAYLEMDYVFPDGEKMCEDLGVNEPRAIKYKDIFTDDVEKLLKTLKHCDDEHTLKWLHYLAYCDSRTADLIRKELKKKNIDVFKFCVLVGDTFRKIKALTYSSTNIQNLKPEAVLQGLQLYGITSNAMLECVSVMMKLPQFTTLHRSTKNEEIIPPSN